MIWWMALGDGVGELARHRSEDCPVRGDGYGLVELDIIRRQAMIGAKSATDLVSGEWRRGRYVVVSVRRKAKTRSTGGVEPGWVSSRHSSGSAQALRRPDEAPDRKKPFG